MKSLRGGAVDVLQGVLPGLDVSIFVMNPIGFEMMGVKLPNNHGRSSLKRILIRGQDSCVAVRFLGNISNIYKMPVSQSMSATARINFLSRPP